jgi:hypothetical protein
VAAMQYTFTHKQYTDYNKLNTHNIKVKTWEMWAVHRFTNYTLPFALQLRKKHGKPSVRVVEK